jgi:hypothetical protein
LEQWCTRCAAKRAAVWSTNAFKRASAKAS